MSGILSKNQACFYLARNTLRNVYASGIQADAASFDMCCWVPNYAREMKKAGSRGAGLKGVCVQEVRPGRQPPR